MSTEAREALRAWESANRARYARALHEHDERELGTMDAEWNVLHDEAEAELDEEEWAMRSGAGGRLAAPDEPRCDHAYLELDATCAVCGRAMADLDAEYATRDEGRAGEPPTWDELEAERAEDLAFERSRELEAERLYGDTRLGRAFVRATRDARPAWDRRS